MKKFRVFVSILMAFCFSVGAMNVSAANKGKTIEIKFDKPAASYALALDQGLDPADYYLVVASYAGVWNTGVVGFDEKEKLLYATSPEGATASNIMRVHFEARKSDLFIDSATYQYAKVEYKLEADLPTGATYTMQFRDAAWYSAPINIWATPNEWHTDAVDLRYMKAWMTKDTYDIGGGDVRENVGGGLGNDVATNGIMLQIESSAGSLAGAKLYIKSITFYEKKEDAPFPVETTSSAAATSSAVTASSSASSSATTSSAATTSLTSTSSSATVSYSRPSSRTTLPGKKGSDSNLPLIIGIVAAVVVVGAAVFVTLYLTRRKRKNTGADE